MASKGAMDYEQLGDESKRYFDPKVYSEWKPRIINGAEPLPAAHLDDYNGGTRERGTDRQSQ